ncbi:MAG TPA: T9SS type A sorting domain-containing protein [Dyadobacter sp.]|nr:T9SS type A sorting domain-containing protein [Dyadobacter sp.]
MVDTDGTFAYSGIRRLFFDDRRLTSFYPNPVGEQLLLDEKVLANAVSVKLLNQAGQQVFETSKPAAAIKTGHLNAGIYLLQVVQKDGNVFSGRVVINK